MSEKFCSNKVQLPRTRKFRFLISGALLAFVISLTANPAAAKPNSKRVDGGDTPVNISGIIGSMGGTGEHRGSKGKGGGGSGGGSGGGG